MNDRASPQSPSWLLFATSIALTLATGHFGLQRHSKNNEEEEEEQQDHNFYLQRAHQLRKALTKPAQSRFRVVAVFVLDNGSLLYGANDEAPPTISGSICAERGALLQYRLLQYEQQRLPQICRIYIVTDADVPVPPGLLCREYMYGHPAVTDTTPIIMQSADEETAPWISNLKELYPYPSLYMKLSVEEQLAAGQATAPDPDAPIKLVASKDGSSSDHVFSTVEIRQVLTEAQNASSLDDRDIVHPIRYGAAVLWVEGSRDSTTRIISASQRKALEYGASQDAVAQLLSRVLLEESQHQHSANQGDTILLLAQVDQFGVVHPPFAAARSFLVEHGFGANVHVVVPSPESGDIRHGLSIVAARSLAPFVPEWK